MSNRIAQGLFCVVALTLVTFSLGASQDAGKSDPTLTTRLNLARDALKAIAATEAGGQPVDHEIFCRWSTRLMDCELASGKDKTARVDAAQAHADRLKRLLNRSQQMARSGQIRTVDVLNVEYHYNEALSGLAREKDR